MDNILLIQLTADSTVSAFMALYYQCSADAWGEGEPLRPPRVSHAFGNISVMAECSSQRTSERAQLLVAMTHPSRVRNLDLKQGFVMPKGYI